MTIWDYVAVVIGYGIVALVLAACVRVCLDFRAICKLHEARRRAELRRRTYEESPELRPKWTPTYAPESLDGHLDGLRSVHDSDDETRASLVSARDRPSLPGAREFFASMLARWDERTMRDAG